MFCCISRRSCAYEHLEIFESFQKILSTHSRKEAEDAPYTFVGFPLHNILGDS